MKRPNIRRYSLQCVPPYGHIFYNPILPQDISHTPLTFFVRYLSRPPEIFYTKM